MDHAAHHCLAVVRIRRLRLERVAFTGGYRAGRFASPYTLGSRDHRRRNADSRAGFRDTRYLGDIFDTSTRVRASCWSQILSTAVYVVFVALALPVVHTLNGHYNDNSLIALVRTAVPLLVAPLVIAAALSQFSAAVADTMAATGNIEETTGGHLKIRWA